MTSQLQRRSFRAMGTICEVAVTAGSGDLFLARRALDAAETEVRACERALSRFDARSDLSRLDSAAGEWVAVKPLLVEALAAALRGRSDTRGLFDPSILPALAAAGYDRSFELLTERAAIPPTGWHAAAQIDIDPRSSRARIERGAAVDLGGIGKGFAATRALAAMQTSWPALPGGLVDLGGDIAILGTPPGGGLWRVDIADPRRRAPLLATLEFTSGGVATSGRDTRRFGPCRQLHHLIDTATGKPATVGPFAATVVAANVAEAEAWATALAVTTIDNARDLLAMRPGIAALLTPQVGKPVAIGPLPLARDRPEARVVVNTQVGRFLWH